MIGNLYLLSKKGVKRLILNMSNNGGGLVVLGMETVRRFSLKPNHSMVSTTDAHRLLTCSSTQNVTSGLNQINGKPFASIKPCASGNKTMQYIGGIKG